jgi:integrase
VSPKTGISTRGGGPADQRNITNRHFKEAVKRAKIEGNVRLYDLRHTMATALLLRGVPVNAVSARLGHASASMTLDVYGHVLPETAEVVASAITDAFFGAEA